ncbi:heat shock protein transcriptional repressor HspR [Raineyella fluvialis]|uniref:MerR family transcriptional regulator n=1 Tax=Raineyella fluvialis TaxID=2662261 RepID=A0A5Q2FAB0_9ACTN|nr:helix-turn-helix transcriptional regulator [Raineyella fluvialis]QGF23739.1 MerR family transcriptional regulator [Raineyella fluvialis]
MVPESSRLPERIDRDAPIFAISVAARLAGMHPQTLRTYDRLGLVSPRRTSGRGRRYSPRNVERLRMIQHLSQAEGINLEGIRRILQMQDMVEDLQRQVSELEERLQQALVAPAGSRFFTADPSGGVRLGSSFGRRHPPRALTSR